ncbi:MAG: YceI family protein [Pseudomonadota bacterium]|uniref:YceI family protein n=1 Tax=Roseovarius salincola TaxID=2978479 RepID=UPI0022A7B853|nr:YceI family protein [Roseovarius sp. EGI FJ00037]MCZ0810687.1 YceI family protein [Roseovarius sp. EGI FJ00037]
MKYMVMAAALTMGATGAFAAPEKYTLDPSHSQVIFSYDHLGFSTTYGMFSGFEGEIMFDQDDPANSSVNVAIPVRSMLTGWEKRFEHFMSEDFFGAVEGDMVTFTSTGIEVTGDTTADITGDLTMNGVTKSVVLAAELNKSDGHPMKDGQAWAGFDATTTLKRSEYGMDFAVPAVSDEVAVTISIEAGKAE